jgi:6-phosphogluconolactonase (cycloisomerase 2 family)
MKFQLINFFIAILCVASQVSNAADILQPTNENYQLDLGVDGFLAPVDGIISEDSRFLYVVGLSGLSVYSTQAATNGIEHLWTYIEGVNGYSGITGLSKLVLSPASENPYLFILSAASQVNSDSPDTLAVFSRQTSGANEGAIEPLAIFENKSTEPGILNPVDLVVSQDNNFVYVASAGDNVIAVFKFTAATPALNMIQVLQNNTNSNNKTISGLNNPTSLTLSPDGKHLYITAEDAVVIFSRNQSDGKLDYIDTVTAGGAVLGLNGPVSIVSSNDGDNVYVASQLSGTIAAFARNSVSGALDFITHYDSSICIPDQNNSPATCLEDVYKLYTTKSNSALFALNLTDNAISAVKRVPWNGELEIHQVLTEASQGGGASAFDFNSFVVAPNGHFAYALLDSGTINKYDLPNVNLTISQVNNVDFIAPGKAFQYQFFISNNGLVQADEVLFETRFTDAVGAAFTSASDDLVCNTTSDLVTCYYFPVLDVGGSTTITIDVTSPASEQILNNQAFVYADQIYTNGNSLLTPSTICVDVPPVAAASVSNGNTYDEGQSDPVQLDASDSSDPCGNVTGYQWTQISGPQVDLQQADTSLASFIVPFDVTGDTELVFQVTVTDDGGASDSTTVVVNIVNINTPPVANTDYCIVPVGSTTDIPVLVNDTDEDADVLKISDVIVDSSLAGTVTGKIKSVQYTAPKTISATSLLDTFGYVAFDGIAQSNQATANILVTNSPIVQDDTVSVVNDTTDPITIFILTNDSGAGDSLELLSVDSESANGNPLQVTSKGNVIYTPSGDKTSGKDTFTYIVTNSATKADAEEHGITLRPDNPCLKTVLSGTVTINLYANVDQLPKPSKTTNTGGGGGGGGGLGVWCLVLLSLYGLLSGLISVFPYLKTNHSH